MVGDLEVTLHKFQKVTVEDPMDGFTFYGAQLEIINAGQGPGFVVARAQSRLENIYVASINPSDREIAEGEPVPFDPLRPGASVEGWVVFGVPDSSALLDSFGFYFSDLEGNEVVWWNPLS